MIHILFYYSTVNFNQKLYGFLILWTDQTYFNYNCILVLKEIDLKMAT